MKYISVFFENLYRKFKFHLNLKRIAGSLHGDQYTFTSMTISGSILVRMRDFTEKVFKENQNTFLLYVFFWVIPRRLNVICRRFGTLCVFHLHRQASKYLLFTYLPMKMEQTECSETSAYKIQTPENYPEENIQHTEHGESLKSRKHILFSTYFFWKS